MDIVNVTGCREIIKLFKQYRWRNSSLNVGRNMFLYQAYLNLRLGNVGTLGGSTSTGVPNLFDMEGQERKPECKNVTGH